MGEHNPAIFLENRSGEYYTEEFRRMISALTGPGVAHQNHLVVSQCATPQLGVAVSEGMGFILGTTNTYQGTYMFEERGGTAVKSIATPHATLGRKDLVIARMLDEFYLGSDSEWQLAIIQGTPHATPTLPATPDSAIPLAQVQVDAGVLSIVNAKITRLAQLARPWNTPWGVLAQASIVADSAPGIGTYDILGLEVTVVLPAGRRIRVEANAYQLDQTGAGQTILTIYEGATQIAAATGCVDNGAGAGVNPSRLLTPSAGSHTYKVRLFTNSTGSHVSAAAGAPAQIVVEDLGPA